MIEYLQDNIVGDKLRRGRLTLSDLTPLIQTEQRLYWQLDGYQVQHNPIQLWICQ